MIPQRLSIRNFLCYRENVPSLDFTGIHVACLCGPNGHGKSALLDAITWCLWGKARGKTQDDLISYGADEARVELDFTARESTYRTIRSHSRGGGRRRQGVTDLQLQLVRNGDVQPLTGDSIRQTQAKIDQIVGMDYDTFINSAYLLQGRADEFSNKPPSDRKAVLAKILGLEVYDRLQERAKEGLAEGAEAAKELEGALGWMRNEAEGIGDPSDELAHVGKNLDALSLRVAEKRREIDDLRGQVRELERQRDQLTELEGQMRTLARDIEQLDTAMAEARSRIGQYKDLVQQADAIKQGAARLEQARLRFEALESARRQFDQIAEGKNSIDRAIATGRARLETQVEQLRHRVESELPPIADAEPVLATEQVEVRSRLEGLEEEAGKIAGQQQDQQTLSTQIGETQSTAERYKTEGLELKSKLELLAGADRRVAGAVCPLCKAPLDQDGCANLAETYDAEIKEKRRLYGQGRPRESQVAQAIIRQILDDMTFTVTGAPRKFSLASRAVVTRNLRYVDFLMPGIVAMAIMQMGLFSVAFAFVQLKSRGILRRLMATPVHPVSFLFSQVFTRLTVSILQTLVLIGTAFIFFDVKIAGNLAAILLLALIGGAVFVSMGFAISGWAKSDEVAAPLANVIALPMMFLSGVFFPRDAMPGAIQKITDFLPLTYLADAMRNIAVDGEVLWSQWPNLIGLGVWLAISFLVAVRLFRWE